MSEKIELIEAKDLPMTEEEDVTVLCVGADGEMKRRDAGSFGMKASDLAKLPTTEAEEVDVICVDAEGNLCRKPGKSFGGSQEYDIVLECIETNVGGMSQFTKTWTLVSGGDYEKIREKLYAGEVVRSLAKVTKKLYNNGEVQKVVVCESTTAEVLEYYTNLHLYFATDSSEHYNCFIHNGEISETPITN